MRPGGNYLSTKKPIVYVCNMLAICFGNYTVPQKTDFLAVT